MQTCSSTTALHVCAFVHHFTGKERDTESGLDHFQFRSYASTMGRWTSPDPGWFLAVDLANPQSFNQYAYVLNTPLNAIDPLGLCGGATAAGETGLARVTTAIGNFFCNLFAGGSDGGSGSGSGGGSGGGGAGGGPSPFLLQPVFSRVETNGDGKVLHNYWRLTNSNGGRVNGMYEVDEHISNPALGTEPDGQGGFTSAGDPQNTFNDGLQKTGFFGPNSDWQKFTARLWSGPGRNKSIPVVVRVGGHDYNVLAIHYHGHGVVPTVNDLPAGALPVVPDPYKVPSGGYGCYSGAPTC